MKREAISHKWYHSKEELEADVTEFVSYFNEFRPLKRLGNLTPDEYENEYSEKLTQKGEQIGNLEFST
jgi:transposase InsO family protein